MNYSLMIEVFYLFISVCLVSLLSQVSVVARGLVAAVQAPPP